MHGPCHVPSDPASCLQAFAVVAQRREEGSLWQKVVVRLAQSRLKSSPVAGSSSAH